MEPFAPVPLPSRPSPFYKLKSIAFSKEAGYSSSLSVAGGNILSARAQKKQPPAEDDADGDLSIAALQAQKERLQADHDRLSGQLKRLQEKYETEHQRRVDSEKVAEDCVRRSKITENNLKSHKNDIKEMQYHVRAVRTLAYEEAVNAKRMVGSMGAISEAMPSGAGPSGVVDDSRHDAPVTAGSSQVMKGAKSPSATVTESTTDMAAEVEPPSPAPGGRKSQRTDGGQEGGLTAQQSLENLLHEVSVTVNAVDAMDEEKGDANPEWEDGADIEFVNLPAAHGPSTPVLRLKHPSGTEAVVHLRTGLFCRWATSDSRVLLGGLPQVWPDVIPYEGQVWSMESDALKDDQDEPSVTLTYVCDARQCRVQMSLSACAHGLRQRITVENLGTHNLVFQVASRTAEASIIDRPSNAMFPPGEALLDARCLDPMPSSPVLVAPSGCWAAMRRWTDRDTSQYQVVMRNTGASSS